MVGTARLLEVRGLAKHFHLARRHGLFSRRVMLKAVDGVSLSLGRREVVGLVGESGCGKTTTGKMIAGLLTPTKGEIFFKGENTADFAPRQKRMFRLQIQMVFQDAMSSLNPRMKIGAILQEPLIINRIGDTRERRERLAEILSEIGLPPDSAGRYPHEFSGGQRQRIGIGRALMLRPDLVVADEPVSALDVSIQAQIINLLLRLRDSYKLAMLLIAHDLSVVRAVCDRVAIMYLGRIVETGNTESVFARPLHPYTQALLSAVPVPDPAIKLSAPPIDEEVAWSTSPTDGCRFADRCPEAVAICHKAEPKLISDSSDPAHAVACFLCNNKSDAYE